MHTAKYPGTKYRNNGLLLVWHINAHLPGYSCEFLGMAAFLTIAGAAVGIGTLTAGIALSANAIDSSCDPLHYASSANSSVCLLSDATPLVAAHAAMNISLIGLEAALQGLAVNQSVIFLAMATFCSFADLVSVNHTVQAFGQLLAGHNGTLEVLSAAIQGHETTLEGVLLDLQALEGHNETVALLNDVKVSHEALMEQASEYFPMVETHALTLVELEDRMTVLEETISGDLNETLQLTGSRVTELENGDFGSRLAELEELGINLRLSTVEGTIDSLGPTVEGHTTSIGTLETTVGGHTTTLGTLGTTVSGHTGTLSTLGSTVSGHTSSISSISSILQSKISGQRMEDLTSDISTPGGMDCYNMDHITEIGIIEYECVFGFSTSYVDFRFPVRFADSSDVLVDITLSFPEFQLFGNDLIVKITDSLNTAWDTPDIPTLTIEQYEEDFVSKYRVINSGQIREVSFVRHIPGYATWRIRAKVKLPPMDEMVTGYINRWIQVRVEWERNANLGISAVITEAPIEVNATEINNRLDVLESTVDGHATAIGGLQTLTGTHAGDISELQTDLGAMELAIGLIEEDITALQGAIGSGDGSGDGGGGGGGPGFPVMADRTAEIIPNDGVTCEDEETPSEIGIHPLACTFTETNHGVEFHFPAIQVDEEGSHLVILLTIEFDPESIPDQDGGPDPAKDLNIIFDDLSDGGSWEETAPAIRFSKFCTECDVEWSPQGFDKIKVDQAQLIGNRWLFRVRLMQWPDEPRLVDGAGRQISIAVDLTAEMTISLSASLTVAGFTKVPVGLTLATTDTATIPSTSAAFHFHSDADWTIAGMFGNFFPDFTNAPLWYPDFSGGVQINIHIVVPGALSGRSSEILRISHTFSGMVQRSWFFPLRDNTGPTSWDFSFAAFAIPENQIVLLAEWVSDPASDPLTICGDSMDNSMRCYVDIVYFAIT